ncbi:hypothetical protein [Neotabrizicola sp. VNH66]|uniref:hypothetical protein n=1 Tax=Neotabrizicola sp. VNH66 TaxID=3400918 RepID=UPI003C126598
MIRPLDLLRRLRPKTATAKPSEAGESLFDLRLKRLHSVRPVSVSRAVLFRTKPVPQEA